GSWPARPRPACGAAPRADARPAAAPGRERSPARRRAPAAAPAFRATSSSAGCGRGAAASLEPAVEDPVHRHATGGGKAAVGDVGGHADIENTAVHGVELLQVRTAIRARHAPQVAVAHDRALAPGRAGGRAAVAAEAGFAIEALVKRVGAGRLATAHVGAMG